MYQLKKHTMWPMLDNNHNEKKDIVILAVPFVESPAPVAAPAALKSSVEKNGFSCLAVDCNGPIYNKVNGHPRRREMMDFWLDGNWRGSVAEEIFQDLDSLTDQILSWQPTWVGLSLLTSATQHTARWILYLLKKKCPQVRTIIGGSGIQTSANSLGIFIQEITSQGILDFYVTGDGELALVELLKGNLEFPGVTGVPKRYLTNAEVDSLPFPDYSDYDLANWHDAKITITASRGCVRQCTFCDYIEFHTKFQWRVADKIFNEMLHQIDRYGVKKFAFADSLVNGNQKEFNRLITLLAEYNDQNSHDPIRWTAYYILRNRSPRDEWLWETLKKSGAVKLAIGIESFNQTTRYEIGKHFDDESILHHFRLAQKNQVTIIVLLLTGYPTETAEDVDKGLEWIRQNRDLNDILSFSFSITRIIPGTQLDRNHMRYGIIMEDSNRAWSRANEWTTTRYNHVNNIENRRMWTHAYYQTASENGFETDLDWSIAQRHNFTNIVEKLSKDPRSRLEDSL